MEIWPSAQSSFQKINFSNSSQKTSKSRYQTVLLLSSFTGFLYSVANILSRILDPWYGFENNADVIVELNIFCDALAQAYGAVAYFVFSNKDDKQNVYSFVLSKLRLSPLKEQCSIVIPKLEFQAAVLAVRLKCIILEEIDFDIDKVRFWTHSKITLSYIRNSSKDFRFIL